MHLLTAIEVAAGAAARWRDQYKHWKDESRFADGSTKKQHEDALNDAPQHTPEAVAKALYDSWAYPTCNSCGEYRHAVVELPGNDYGHNICLPCAEQVAAMLGQVPNARDIAA